MKLAAQVWDADYDLQIDVVVEVERTDEDEIAINVLDRGEILWFTRYGTRELEKMLAVARRDDD